MPIHLVRHGHAGSRRDWAGDDEARPLSTKGRRQAESIARDLSGTGVDLLWSSRYARCIQTLEPMADQLGRSIVEHPLLAEGAPGPDALDALLVATADGHTLAASSHGDVIPAILSEAQTRGAHLHGTSAPRKGARYVLDVVGGAVTTITHVDQPR